MGVSVLNTSVCLYNGSGRLLSDGRYSWNVVGGISHQGLHIDKFRWSHMVLILHILRIVVFNLRTAPAGLWNPDLDMLVGQLEQIAVT